MNEFIMKRWCLIHQARWGQVGGGHLIEHNFGVGGGASQEAGADELYHIQTGSGGPDIEEAWIEPCHLGCQGITPKIWFLFPLRPYLT